MMKYNYKRGTYEAVKPSFIDRLVLMATGGAIGLVAAVCVVYGQVQSSVQPVVTQDTPSSLSVQPVTVQKFSDVTEPSDVQPALGVGMVQVAMPDRNYQPAQVAGYYQPAARYGVLQHAVTDYQLQGEQLKLN